MANSTFGTNILPKNNTVTIGNSDSPWTIVSPSMTGVPTAPTAEEGTSTTQIATTEFVQNELQDKAILKSITNTNPVLTITDGADSMPMGMVLKLEPVQDLHGQANPYPAGGGKNKCSVSYAEKTSTSAGYAGKNIDTIPAGTYTLSALVTSTNTTDNNCRISFRNSSSQNATLVYLGANSGQRTSATFTLEEPAVKIYFYPSEGAGDNSNTSTFTDIMICLSTATDPTVYAPYENKCPISGHTGCDVVDTGKNLIPNGTDTNNGYKNGNRLSASDGSYAAFSDMYVSEYFKVVGGQKYTYSKNVTDTYARPAVCFYDANKNFISGFEIGNTVTAPANAVYARATQWGTNANIYQLESGDTATAVSAPDDVKLSITFTDSQGNPITVYGGELSINKDGTGRIVDNYKIYSLPLTGWGYASDVFNISMPSDSKAPATAGREQDGVCSHYALKYNTSLQGFKTFDSAIMYNNKSYSSSRKIVIRDTRFDNTTNFEAFLSDQNTAGTPVKMVYKLDAPVTYDLTASQVGQILSLLGINNLWSNEAETTVIKLDYFTHNIGTEALNELINIEKQVYKTNTIASDVMTITDGADNMPMELKVGIDPVQDLHGYDYPWVGGAGKNIFDPTDVVEGNKYVRYSDGQYIVPGSGQWLASRHFPVKAGVTYYFGYNHISSGNAPGIAWFDSNDQYISGVKDSVLYSTPTMTAPENAAYVAISIETEDVYNPNYATTAYVCKNGDLTAWEPYSNICPISGHTGCDVVDTGKNVASLATFTNKKEINSSTGTVDANDNYKVSDGYIPVKPSTTYAFQMNKVTSNSRGGYIGFYGSNKQFLRKVTVISVDSATGVRSGTFTTESTDAFIKIQVPTATLSKEVQIEEGSIATAYESAGIDKTITFTDSQGNPITVYGGELTINKDGTGELKVIDYGDTVSNLNNQGSNRFEYINGYFYKNKEDLTNEPKTAADTTVAPGLKCAFLPAKSRNAVVTNGEIGIDINHFATMQVRTGQTTLEDFITTYGSQVIVYRLATPVTYDLTAAQVGQILSLLCINNIYADCGNILSCGYFSHDTDTEATNELIDAKVSINQGSANAGKFLVVNSNGVVEPVAMSAWAGGVY